MTPSCRSSSEILLDCNSFVWMWKFAVPRKLFPPDLVMKLKIPPVA